MTNAQDIHVGNLHGPNHNPKIAKEYAFSDPKKATYNNPIKKQAIKGLFKINQHKQNPKGRTVSLLQFHS